MTDYLSWLEDDNILIVSVPLAQALGIGSSIVLRRIAHWISHNKKSNTNYRDNYYWTWN